MSFSKPNNQLISLDDQPPLRNSSNFTNFRHHTNLRHGTNSINHTNLRHETLPGRETKQNIVTPPFGELIESDTLIETYFTEEEFDISTFSIPQLQEFSEILSSRQEKTYKKVLDELSTHTPAFKQITPPKDLDSPQFLSEIECLPETEKISLLDLLRSAQHYAQALTLLRNVITKKENLRAYSLPSSFAIKTDATYAYRSSFQEDPLYRGSLFLKDFHPIAHEVMATPAFQRLYGIYQGGAKGDPIRNNLWLPETLSRGTHSRSVGLLTQHLVQNERGLIADKVHLVLAGLLHDIGHTAFSHAGEEVTSFCHKQITEDILLHDEELHKIWQKHGIDPKMLTLLITQKVPGNPVTVPRGAGILSLDHLNNMFLDLYTRTGDQEAQKLAQLLLHALYLSEDGVITLKKEFSHLEPAILRTSIKHNLAIIFDKKELLLDQVGYIVFRQLIDTGIISEKDFLGSQTALTSLLHSSKIQDMPTPELVPFLLHGAPNLTPQQIDQAVQRLPLSESAPLFHSERESTIASPHLSRIITSTYLSATAVQGKETLPLNGASAKLNQKLCGTYTFDIPKLLASLASTHSTK